MTKHERQLLALLDETVRQLECHVEYLGITGSTHVAYRVVNDETGEARKLFTGFTPSCNRARKCAASTAKRLARKIK